MELLFKNNEVELSIQQDNIVFQTGEKKYLLSSHPYEPCTYIRSMDGTTPNIAIHNAWNMSDVVNSARKKDMLGDITGKSYDIETFCGFLVIAIEKSIRSKKDNFSIESINNI